MAIELSCGALAATWLPEHGMVGASFRHDGRELLGQRGGLEAYLERGSAFGIPLLAPWANRLDGMGYGEVEVEPEWVKLDEHGLPKDGVMAARPWTVLEQDDASLRAGFDASSPDAGPGVEEILRVFPFPHRWEVAVSLDVDTLSVTTTLAATGEVPVPVSFGWHPLFQLPGVDRDQARLTVPGLREAVLDDRGIPTGETVLPTGVVADNEFHELDGAFVLSGEGQSITVSFGAPGYPVGHVWCPPGQPFVAWEPMTAPTNALRSGDGLRHVAPGESFSASFRVTYSG